jgi:uncharacterized membrane protein YuzA (DUF378 family)
MAATLPLRALDRIALILLIIGGLNWGLVGAFEVNLVTVLFGPSSTLSRIIYILIGIAGLYAIYMLARVAARRG